MANPDMYEQYEKQVATMLAQMPEITSDVISRTVEMFATMPVFSAFTAADRDALTRRMEARFTVQMNLGHIVQTPFTPWYLGRKAEIEPFYWERYRMSLIDRGMGLNVVSRLDEVTDRIVGLFGDPIVEGNWRRTGLVVGHVQSGKTANYIGVINKAADAGYRLIILVAGTLNNLRRQTQERIDEGFVGRASAGLLRRRGEASAPLGVGRYGASRHPVVLTSTEMDFSINAALGLGLSLQALNEPLILVIKKNVKTLNNLIQWLKNHNMPSGRKIESPMVLIDDEADNASINTAAADADATAINKKLRELLHLFDHSTYVGYTATPFANIFVDPENDDEMLGDDLFPRDFIVSLDPPTNYVGPELLFGDPPESQAVIDITDYESILPLKHKNGHVLNDLPESLYNAIRMYLLARAARILRGNVTAHNSMLINVSRFNNVQDKVAALVREYKGVLERAIRATAGLSEREALNNPKIRDLEQTWQKEHSNVEFSWHEIRRVLLEAIAPVEVRIVNATTGPGALQYSGQPDGVNVIAVGGLSLSRGLTLEGLTVSYVLRNSQMYDTLLQMGRWFGYRDGYRDLCRVYLHPEARLWYQHITEATEELREEFHKMESLQLVPKDFGLLVRSHPDSLMVTAKNKMRTARLMYREIDLAGRLIETDRLDARQKAIDGNIDAAKRLLELLQRTAKPELQDNGSLLWMNVSHEQVVSFVRSFQNHPASLKTQTEPVSQYITAMASDGINSWDIVLAGKAESPQAKFEYAGGYVYPQTRSAEPSDADPPSLRVSGERARVGSRGVEKYGIPKPEIKQAEEEFKANHPDVKNYPDRCYRAIRKRPLLMIHPLALKCPEGIVNVLAYGMSFPGATTSRRIKARVQYQVNTVWWNTYYGDEDSDESDTQNEEEDGQ